MIDIDDSLVDMIIEKVAEFTISRMKADEAWKRETEKDTGGSHYCGGRCDACREIEHCQNIKGQIKALLHR